MPLRVHAPFNISEVRFGFVEAPVAQPTFLGFGVQGDIVPVGSTTVPPITPPALPPFDASDGKFFIEGR